MNEIVFNTTISKDGYLYCPKEFSFKDASYKVIVTIPQNIATSKDIEVAAVSDSNYEYLTKEEINYYMALD